jgi:hypothetical protein
VIGGCFWSGNPDALGGTAGIESYGGFQRLACDEGGRAPGGRRAGRGGWRYPRGLARRPDECYGVGELSGIVQTD